MWFLHLCVCTTRHSEVDLAASQGQIPLVLGFTIMILCRGKVASGSIQMWLDICPCAELRGSQTVCLLNKNTGSRAGAQVRFLAQLGKHLAAQGWVFRRARALYIGAPRVPLCSAGSSFPTPKRNLTLSWCKVACCAPVHLKHKISYKKKKYHCFIR